MRRLLLALTLLNGCGEPFAPPVDGVYSLCEEVSGFSGEILELRNGTFRYWFYSDVVTGHEPTYPLTGSYGLSGSTLTLGHSDIYSNNRTLDVVNGVPVIWRNDGLAAWTKDRKIHAYAVLIKVDGVIEASPRLKRPSIALIKCPRG